jgi:hypothetical protein
VKELRESQIEERLRTGLMRFGFKVLKLTTPGNAGTPDRLILRPYWSPGPPWVIEIKRPKKSERRLQEVVRDDWRARGVLVLDMVNTYEQVDALIIRLVMICLGDALK